jgi:hypothetical protein
MTEDGNPHEMPLPKEGMVLIQGTDKLRDIGIIPTYILLNSIAQDSFEKGMNTFTKVKYLLQT